MSNNRLLYSSNEVGNSMKEHHTIMSQLVISECCAEEGHFTMHLANEP